MIHNVIYMRKDTQWVTYGIGDSDHCDPLDDLITIHFVTRDAEGFHETTAIEKRAWENASKCFYDFEAYGRYYSTKDLDEFIGKGQDMQDYRTWKRNKALEDRLGKDAFYAFHGDIIEVVKGRKYPKGTRFVVDREYVFYDRYHRPQEFYWITKDKQRVAKGNCIIVGHEGDQQ